MNFGNLGFAEILVIAVLVLIFFGPRRMPEIGRAVGGALREFRRGMNEIQRELQEAERAASIDPEKPPAATAAGQSAGLDARPAVPAEGANGPEGAPAEPPERQEVEPPEAGRKADAAGRKAEPPEPLRDS